MPGSNSQLRERLCRVPSTTPCNGSSVQIRLYCQQSRNPCRSSLRSEREGGEGLSGRLDTVHFCQSHRKLRNWVEARIVPTFKSRLTFTLTTATHIRPPFILVATRAETFDTLSTLECSSASSTFWVDENVN